VKRPEEKDTEERLQSSSPLNHQPAPAAVSADAAPKDELEAAQTQPLHGVGEQRNPLTVLILGFLTCYIYLFYWWYVTGVDIKRALGRDETNPPLELALNLLTCSLYSIYLSYKYPKLVLEMQERARVPPDDKSLVSVLLSLFSLGPIACYLIQTDLNRIWDMKESVES
jgi:hypothetical protein